MSNLSAGIVGATGYAGGELARWLLNHPNITLTRVYSTSYAGKRYADVIPGFQGFYDLQLEAPTTDNFQGIDILFLATPHGAATAVAKAANDVAIIVDLSRDHRHADGWVYGQPEWSQTQIEAAKRIAAPGCFATAISLALAPLVQEDAIIGDVQVVAATGSTGSGAKAKAATHHPDRFTNIKAYKVLQHQHIPEILSFLEGIGRPPDIHFVPLSAPVDRGILATIFTKVPDNFDLLDCFQNAYNDKPFVRIRKDTPELRHIRSTAFADIAIHQQGQNGVILVAIDNLGKGAASQAIQATNISCGFSETTGIFVSTSIP